MDNQLALLTLFGSILALAFAASRAARVLKFPQGNEQMQKISSSIHHGAMAYLRRQYRILICFFAGMFVILFAMPLLPGDSSPVFPALWECRSLPGPMPGQRLPASMG